METKKSVLAPARKIAQLIMDTAPDGRVALLIKVADLLSAEGEYDFESAAMGKAGTALLGYYAKPSK